MYRICICDDDRLLLAHAEELVDKLMPGSEISTYLSGDALLSALQSGEQIFDIMLLDIVLGTKSGMEIAKEVSRLLPECLIIYITNYTGYLSDVYETQHIYYVLKEEMDRRLPDALKKAEEILHRLESRRLMIKIRSREVLIPPQEILYVERSLRSSTIVCEGKTYETTETLDLILQRLDTIDFCRCHVSYIVSFPKVREFLRGSFLLTNGQEIPISRAYYDIVRSRFARYMGGK